MKTAISIPDDLFDELCHVSKEEHISRSGLFVEALRNYLQARENRKLFTALNEAYGAPESLDEQKTRRTAKKYYVRKVHKEKW